MRNVDSRTGLELIDREECLRLLAGEEVGRLAVIVGGEPAIFPVNFVLDGETIVFRTDDGTKGAGRSSARGCFEVDGIDTRAPRRLERRGIRSDGGGLAV